MRKLGIVLAALFLLGGFTYAQNVIGAVRVTQCINMIPFTAEVLCNVTGYAETQEFGVFLQVTPRYGPALENFQTRIYTNNLSWEFLDFARVQQTGVTVGRELGDWFIRVETDVIIEFSF